MELLCGVAESDGVSEDTLLHLTGVCCFLDTLFLMHTSTAISYLWGIASASSERGLLVQIAEKHKLEHPGTAIALHRQQLTSLSRPSSIADLSGFFYGLHERLKDTESLAPLSDREIGCLRNQAAADLP